ncbi:MAG: NAD-dependent epimerase/dehydratase family protein [Planctomycetes bacterium]|nr:NAD-dependent epimerase/dehydratase family protein [Planctomycetota bacterium]
MSGTGQRVSLVTGGGGFVGSHLVERLLRRGDNVVVVDDFSTGRRENLRDADPGRVEIVEGDVAHVLGALDPRRFDEIYHLAAAVGVRLVIEQPIHTIETNVEGTSAVFQFAAVNRTPVLITSTSEVYGKTTATPFGEDDDVVYGPTTLHRWSYACSKAIDEYLGLAWHREHDLPVAIVRLFNTVGPRQVGTYGMVLPRFVAAALAGEPLEVYGDGRQTRCFCDVRDVVRALPQMLGTPACHGRVFNLGHDVPVAIRALAELVVHTLDSASPIRNVPYDEAFGAGFDDLRDRRPDLTRIREAIDFAPSIPLEETIRDLARAGEAERSVESSAS